MCFLTAPLFVLHLVISVDVIIVEPLRVSLLIFLKFHYCVKTYRFSFFACTALLVVVALHRFAKHVLLVNFKRYIFKNFSCFPFGLYHC